MLVSEYFEEAISQKPLRYQTKINMVRCLKKLELWDLEYSEITSHLCWQRIEGLLNQNVKRTYGLSRQCGCCASTLDSKFFIST